MKKWMSLLLAAVVLFTCIPLDTLATEAGDRTVVSLAVTTLPDKVKYLPGEVLDLTGLTAEAAYSDGSVELLSPEKLTVEAPDPLESGNLTVKISYEGQDASFEIHVHTVRTVEAVEPTYMETGLTEGKVCDDPACGEILQAQEILPVKAPPELAAPEIAAKVSADGVVISWDAVEYAETYEVYRRTGDGEWTLLATVTDTGYTDSAAPCGAAVSYTVRACVQTADGLVTGAFGEKTGVFFLEAKLTNVADGVSIQWTALEEASYYRIYRRLPGDSWETICSKTTEDSFVDADVESGVTYQYAVRAYADGAYTNYHYDLELIRLTQPEATASNKAGGVRLNWDEIPGAESYNIYRREADGSWERIANVTAVTYLDAGAEGGTAYYYRVRAKNGTTLSSNKHRVGILRLELAQMSLSNITKGVFIEWEAVAGAESYRIYRKVTDGSWKLLAKDLTELSYTDTAAEPGVTYYYSVRAYSDGLYSARHNSEYIIRLEQPKMTVTNKYNGIKVVWNEVEGAESYNVYRKLPDGSLKRLANVTETSYVDKSAEGDTTYYYTVRAKNGSTLSSNNRRVRIQRLAETEMKVYNVYSGVSINWTAVEGAETYRVYRRISGGWELLKKDLTDLTYVDTTAESGNTYRYAVRAYNATGGSGYSSSKEIIHLSQPDATAANKAGGIRITWNEIQGAESYNVYRKITGGSWERITNVTDTTYLDTDTESGTTYHYRVRAKSGGTLSGNKQKVVILRLAYPVATVSNANKGVHIAWNEIVGAESYRVYRKVPDGNWKALATDVETTEYTDTTAKSGKTYYYSVRAYGAGVLSISKSTEAIEYLARPVASAKTVSTTSVKVTWKAVEGAQSYILYAKTEDTDWEKLYTGTDTSYTAKKLTFGETYSFCVRALGSANRSVRSVEVTGKATYPAPSYSLELEPGEGIRISWKSVDGAGSYRVYRRTEGGSWKSLKTTTSTSWVDTSGKPGVTYEYAVRAFELKGAEGVSGIRATGKTIVYSKIDPDKPMIALTFDDGPSQYTADILDQLEKYDSHATFFVVGNRVSSYAGTIERAYKMGCEIGNHSWSHPSLSSISVSAMKEELSKTDAAIEKIIGEPAALLRPPYGAVDADVQKYAGKPLIHWSVDTRDWDTQSSSSTISSVLKNARDGSIILMHDIYSATRNAAVSLIPTLVEEGYQLVTVSEMAAYRGITLEDGTIYYSIKP